MSLEDKRTTKLSIIEDVNPKYGEAYTSYSYERDITDLGSTELIEDIVKAMRLMGYHDVAIWRSLKEQTDDLYEYLESIDNAKDEWKGE